MSGVIFMKNSFLGRISPRVVRTLVFGCSDSLLLNFGQKCWVTLHKLLTGSCGNFDHFLKLLVKQIQDCWTVAQNFPLRWSQGDGPGLVVLKPFSYNFGSVVDTLFFRDPFITKFLNSWPISWNTASIYLPICIYFPSILENTTAPSACVVENGSL